MSVPISSSFVSDLSGARSTEVSLMPAGMMACPMGADPRSGRWTGSGKTECGLHENGVAVRPSSPGGEWRT